MKFLVPVSYFFGNPHSEIWQLDSATSEKKRLCLFSSTTRDVRGKGITGLSWLDDDYLVACDFNRLLKIDRHSWSIVHSVEDDEFNDLHQLSVSEGKIYLANTGRDSIDIFDAQLNRVNRLDGLTQTEWEKRKHGRYEVSGPYFDTPNSGLPFHRRRGPDKWHFNHVFKGSCALEDRIIATSFVERALIDAYSLAPLSTQFPTQPHDGFVHEDKLWVTTVSGQIYCAPLTLPLVFEKVFDLSTHAPYQGWCRGLYVTADQLYIGITAIYEKSNRTSWLKGSIANTRSGIYKVDLSSLRVAKFFDFTSEDGSRIFSLESDK